MKKYAKNILGNLQAKNPDTVIDCYYATRNGSKVKFSFVGQHQNLNDLDVEGYRIAETKQTLAKILMVTYVCEKGGAK